MEPTDTPMSSGQVSVLIRPVLERHGVRRASIYGSIATGTARRDSDVDLLVELPPEKSLLDLVALKRELEDVLGRTVDLAEFDTLHPMIRDQVLTHQVAVV